MTLSSEQVRRFYDRLGRRQDWQRYEDAALDSLAAQGRFDAAWAVFEFGCGTGRLAERLLREQLPADARYVGVDLSATMVRLATERLERWSDRVAVIEGDGLGRLEAEGTFDRLVATYVLDLLDESAITGLLDKAHRALAPEGLACLASLTFGTTAASRLTVGLWRTAYAVAPYLLGGCRPIRVLDFLPHDKWDILHREVVVSMTVPSEVVIARRLWR
jgi:SAM-dependent methyltransferase